MARKRRVRNPNPVRPRAGDALKYEQAMRKKYVEPIYRRMRTRMATAVAASEALRAMDEVVEELIASPYEGVPVGEIKRQMARIEGYHRERLIRTFRAALAVDVTPFLTTPAIAQKMAEIVVNNVSLIKSIPLRFRDNVRDGLLELIQTQPFDQQLLDEVLKRNYRMSRYNLRRITRDQTSKTIGALNEVRQQQVGVERYQWITAQDERVRSSHVANSGRMFDWGNPPAETGHPGEDIMCRCVAVPVMTKATVDRLHGIGPHSITDIDTSTLPGNVIPTVVNQPPLPPKAKKPPKVGSSLTWAQIDRGTSRSKAERDYHEQADMWGDRRSVSARIAGEIDGLEGSVVHATRDNAWYSQVERQIEMDGYKPNDYGGRFVWMHEFGHYIDNVMFSRTRSMGFRSDAAEFTSARRAEATRMRKGSGGQTYDHWTGENGFNKPLNDDAAVFMKLNAPERRKLLDEMANTVGFTVDEFDELVSRHGYKFITRQKGINLPDELHEALAYRFMRALEENDVQGAMDTVTFGYKSMHHFFTKQAGLDEDLYNDIRLATYKHARGALSMVSDICDAITTGKIGIGYGHGATYWRRGQVWRNREIFANMTSLDAEDVYTRKLAKRLFPHMHDEVIDSMKQYLDEIGRPYTDETTSALDEYKEMQMKSKARKKKIATGGT